MARDTSTVKVLMQSVIAQLERLGIVWWIFDGYSIRRMHQTELLMEVDDGSGSENHFEEPEPERGDVREGEAGVEAGDDGGDPLRREAVGQPKVASKTAASAIEKTLLEKGLERPKRTLPRRRRRQR